MNKKLKPTVAPAVRKAPAPAVQYNGSLSHEEGNRWLLHTGRAWGSMEFKTPAAAEAWCKKGDVRFLPIGYTNVSGGK